MIIASYGTVDKGKNPQELNDKYLNGAYVGGGDVSILSNANKANGITIIDVSRQSAVKSNPTTYVANNSSATAPLAVAIYCDNCADNGHWVIAVGKDSSGAPLVWDPLKSNQTTPVALNNTNYPGLDLTNNGSSIDVRQVITSSQ